MHSSWPLTEGTMSPSLSLHSVLPKSLYSSIAVFQPWKLYHCIFMIPVTLCPWTIILISKSLCLSPILPMLGQMASQGLFQPQPVCDCCRWLCNPTKSLTGHEGDQFKNHGNSTCLLISLYHLTSSLLLGLYFSTYWWWSTSQEARMFLFNL